MQVEVTNFWDWRQPLSIPDSTGGFIHYFRYFIHFFSGLAFLNGH